MNCKDLNQLAHWINGRASLRDVESVPMVGIVGNERFGPAAVRAFRLSWEWSTVRLSSAKQDRAYFAHGGKNGGMAFLNRRFARCRAILERNGILLK